MVPVVPDDDVPESVVRDSQAAHRLITRAYATILIPVIGPVPSSLPGSRWQPGPLDLVLPDGVVTDADARGTYFQARASEALYSDFSRWHTSASVRVRDAELVALELLAFPEYWQPTTAADGSGSGYLALFHLALPAEDPLECLWWLVELADTSESSARACLNDVLGEWHVAREVRRATSLCFLAFNESPPKVAAAPTGWDPLTSWLWWAASATPFEVVPPDVEDPTLLAGLTFLSMTWRALVLRDGVGFIGRDPDAPCEFYDFAQKYVQSIYADVVALALTQRYCLNSLANRLAAIGDRHVQRDVLHVLTNDLTEFRNVYWWQDVTSHTVGNELLVRLQSAYGTGTLFDRVVADVNDFRRQVDAEAAGRATEAQVEVERRSKLFDQWAAFVGLAFVFPALLMTALSVPIRGVTDSSHSISIKTLAILSSSALGLGLFAGLLLFIRLSRPKAQRVEQVLSSRPDARAYGSELDAQRDHPGADG
jgi:hypothetical protein